MDKQKVKAIEEWGVPVTELRSFLGLLNEILICISGSSLDTDGRLLHSQIFWRKPWHWLSFKGIRQVPASLWGLEEGRDGGTRIEVARLYCAFRSAHWSIRLCHWKSIGPGGTPKPKAQRAKQVREARSNRKRCLCMVKSGALPEDVEALLAFGLDLWSRLLATSYFATQKKLSPKRAGRISWRSLTLC